MRNKEQISKKIDQISNAVSALESAISRGLTVDQLRDFAERTKEKLQEMQTLINTESDSWN